MSVRTATRNFDLELAIAPLRLPTHRLGKRESDQSRAKQHKTRNGHSEETVRSKLLTHGAPPNRAPRALLEGNNCPVAWSKELPSDVQFRSRLMFWCNTCSEMSRSYGFQSSRTFLLHLASHDLAQGAVTLCAGADWPGI
jgi:hypothetical protein